MTPREIAALGVTPVRAPDGAIGWRGPRAAVARVVAEVLARAARLAPQVPATGPIPVLSLQPSRRYPSGPARAGEWQDCVVCGVDTGTGTTVPVRVVCDLCGAASQRAMRDALAAHRRVADEAAASAAGEPPP